jgi:hypothetical protein
VFFLDAAPKKKKAKQWSNKNIKNLIFFCLSSCCCSFFGGSDKITRGPEATILSLSFRNQQIKDDEFNLVIFHRDFTPSIERHVYAVAVIIKLMDLFDGGLHCNQIIESYAGNKTEMSVSQFSRAVENKTNVDGWSPGFCTDTSQSSQII